MARVVSVFNDACEYVLDIDDNRAEALRPDGDPFVVTLEPLTGAEVDSMDRDLGRMSRGNINVVTRAQKHRDKIVLERVKTVRGYIIKSPKGDVLAEPKDARELLSALKIAGGAETDLILDELVEALKDHSKLEAGLLDRLSSRSE